MRGHLLKSWHGLTILTLNIAKSICIINKEKTPRVPQSHSIIHKQENAKKRNYAHATIKNSNPIATGRNQLHQVKVTTKQEATWLMAQLKEYVFCRSLKL